MSQEEIIERLQAENAQLKEEKAQESAEKAQALAENRQLRELVEELSKSLHEKTQEAAEKAELVIEKQRLESQVEELSTQVHELLGRVAKDSSNSSKPQITRMGMPKRRGAFGNQPGRNQEGKEVIQAVHGTWWKSQMRSSFCLRCAVRSVRPVSKDEKPRVPNDVRWWNCQRSKRR
jgi:uncharacterized protein YdhG (YjbR/CyaY superfamily)